MFIYCIETVCEVIHTACSWRSILSPAVCVLPVESRLSVFSVNCEMGGGAVLIKPTINMAPGWGIHY